MSRSRGTCTRPLAAASRLRTCTQGTNTSDLAAMALSASPVGSTPVVPSARAVQRPQPTTLHLTHPCQHPRVRFSPCLHSWLCQEFLKATSSGNAGELSGTDGIPPASCRSSSCGFGFESSGPDFSEIVFGGAPLCGSALSTRTNEGECCRSWARHLPWLRAPSVESAGGAGSRCERARDTPVIRPYTAVT